METTVSTDKRDFLSRDEGFEAGKDGVLLLPVIKLSNLWISFAKSTFDFSPEVALKNNFFVLLLSLLGNRLFIAVYN